MTVPVDADASARPLPLWVRVIDRVTVASAMIAAVATVAMGLHVIADVIGRSAFGRPLPATLELVSYGWMPAVVFMGLAFAQLKNEHLRATLSVDRLPARPRRIANVIAFAVAGAIIGMMLGYAAQSGLKSVAIREMRPAAIDIALWPFRLVVVFGLALLLAQTVAAIYRLAHDERAAGVSEEQALLTDLDREATGEHHN